MIVLVQSSFHTTWDSLFEIELELNSLDGNGNKLEHELELEDMKRTQIFDTKTIQLWFECTASCLAVVVRSLFWCKPSYV